MHTKSPWASVQNGENAFEVIGYSNAIGEDKKLLSICNINTEGYDDSTKEEMLTNMNIIKNANISYEIMTHTFISLILLEDQFGKDTVSYDIIHTNAVLIAEHLAKVESGSN